MNERMSERISEQNSERISQPTAWTLLNQRYLYQAVGGVGQLLNAVQSDQKSAKPAAKPAENDAPKKYSLPTPSWPAEHPPPALTTLCRVFNLSAFERGILLLCTAVEIAPDLAGQFAAVQRVPPRPYPTLDFALKYLAQGHWDALTPAAPLRHWQLIDLLGEEPLTTQALKLDERILHYLMGVSYLDPLLARCVLPVSVPVALPPSQACLAKQISQGWQNGEWLRVNLYGGSLSSREAIAAAACGQGQLYALDVNALPTDSEGRSHFQRRWEREAALGNHSLLIHANLGRTPNSTPSTPPEKTEFLRSFIQRQQGRLIVSSDDPLQLPTFASGKMQQFLRLEVTAPSNVEQVKLWQQALGDLSGCDLSEHDLSERVDSALGPLELGSLDLGPLVSQFELDPEGIFQVGEQLRSQVSEDSAIAEKSALLKERLWQTCRQQARTTLDDLAQRLIPTATWEDLVLPAAQMKTLRAIVASVQQRSQVYEAWGFGRKNQRGLGISALFAGSSGTGKTLSAEVLSQALKLDLYRIDLSTVVSKYIGETEKNLRRIFDAAEQGGVILLFDEADALFGKRSEVKDSHDRHANIEVSYLLQRMETYRGLAILTTNFKSAIDSAFLRRIRFVVSFPFPDVSQRQEIWQRVFPAQTPTSDLVPQKLAQLTVPGGNIYSIAMNAAFLAAAEATSVQMQHVLQAAQSEYTKLDKKLADAEVRGWI